MERQNNTNKNNETTNSKTASNQQIVSLNIPITTTETKLQEVLDALSFDAPLPPLDEVDQINLQITIQPEVKNGVA